MPATIKVRRTFLEMTSPADLKPAPVPSPEPMVQRLVACSPSTLRQLYVGVGRDFRWTDRLSWTEEQTARHLSEPRTSIWLLSSQDVPAGYFELHQHRDDSVEIVYFGLLPGFIGRGWGKFLLTRAVKAAWELGPSRVWLHTCTLDHPAALPNYLKRGFRWVREETYEVKA
jgi:GNAT superfamily N-acetyltransferase